MESQKKYVSLFKIDGVPILPPLMTERKRQEMRNYKELALAIEMKLKLENNVGEKTSYGKISSPSLNLSLDLSEFMKEISSEKIDIEQKTDENSYTFNSPKKGNIDQDYEWRNFSQRKFQTNLECGDSILFNSSPRSINVDQEHDDLISKNISSRRSDTDGGSDITITPILENEYFKVSNIFKRPQTTESRIEHKNDKDFLRNLKRSDLFICDVTSNTLMIPSMEKKVAGVEIENSSASDKICEIKETKIENKLKRSDFIQERNISKITGMKSPSKSPLIEMKSFQRKIPSISIYPPTPKKEFKNQNIGENKTQENRILPKRASTSPAINNIENDEKKFIRSNSFTLESPSNALIEHIVKCKREELNKIIPRSNNDVSDNNFITKIEKLQKDNKPTHTVSPKTSVTSVSQNIKITKHKKSPYDTKIIKISKSVRKYKAPLSKTSSITSLKRKSRSPIGNQQTPTPTKKFNQIITAKPPPTTTSLDNFDDIQNMIENIEKKHHTKMKNLLEKQQEEQKLLQENFEKQQKLLLKKFNSNIQITNSSTNASIKSAWSDELNSLNNNHQLIQNDVNNKCRPSTVSNFSSPNKDLLLNSAKSTPRRRLFSIDTTKIFGNSNARKRQEKAATIINAYVRGYLVRRLFKTDYVQRIVQIIHDTLLFVIDLHIETKYDDSEENIKLKARLLQQLTSACQKLHEIFFEYSIKDRMEIIAKDRNILKTKAIKYQGSPRKTL